MTREQQFNRLEQTRCALLEFTNARLASCIMFEPPIDDDKQILKAMRISLDLWEDELQVEEFARAKPPYYSGIDFDLVASWKDALHGPMACMETDGDKAFFLCEDTAFEVMSLGRRWPDMVPFAPDMVVATLLPFEDMIVCDGLIVRHYCHAAGSGVERLQREFEEAKQRGIVNSPDEFASASRSIKQFRRKWGLDPVSYVTYDDAVNQINAMTSDTCFPYVHHERMRPVNYAA